MVTLLSVDWGRYDAIERRYEWRIGSGRIYTFESNPSEVSFSRKIDWRQRHSGRSRLKKTRWKGRETVTLRMSGTVATKVHYMDIQRFAITNARWRFKDTDDCFFLATNDEADFGTTTDETVDRWFICTGVDISRKTGKGSKIYGRYTLNFDMVKDAVDVVAY